MFHQNDIYDQECLGNTEFKQTSQNLYYANVHCEFPSRE